MINASVRQLTVPEVFQRAIALDDSGLSRRYKERVCAHGEIHDVLTNDHGIQMSIFVEILVRTAFSPFHFRRSKTFNRGALTLPAMSPLNSPSLLCFPFSSVFPGQRRFVNYGFSARSLSRFGFNYPTEFFVSKHSRFRASCFR